MTAERGDDDLEPRQEHDAGASDDDGLGDSDDTTQADAGMAGGTGARPGAATLNPGGTKPQSADEETGTSEPE